MAKVRHCGELQHGPVIELFPELQTNSTDRTDRTIAPPRITSPTRSLANNVRRQILRKETTSQPQADSTDDPDLPSYDRIAEANGGRCKEA